MPDVPPVEYMELEYLIDDEPGMAEHIQKMDEEAERASQRRGQKPPMKWGTPMGEKGYFCVPCWQSGGETGYHGHEYPPCDPLPEPDWK